MNFLLIGSGGREHAHAWKLTQELQECDTFYVTRANPGILSLPHVQNIDISPDNIEGLVNFAAENNVYMTFTGSENQLVKGAVDKFQAHGLDIFGPTQRAAMIETSKAYSKRFMYMNNIPTSQPFYIDDNLDDTRRHSEQLFRQYGSAVIKVDGLAQGKGVFVCRTEQDIENALRRISSEKDLRDAAGRIVTEKLLESYSGNAYEASFIAWTDGQYAVPLVPTEDHKPVFDGDIGPNTGGMGTNTRPLTIRGMEDKIMREVIYPAINGLASDGRPYKGVLYAGLMIVDDQIYVLEFNARYGDPEMQPTMMVLKSSLIDISNACIDGNLDKIKPEWSNEEAACIVLTSKGYPGDYSQNTGKEIYIAENIPEYAQIFHAGTGRNSEGKLINTGGRVLGITARGPDLRAAVDRAYNLIDSRMVFFEDMHFRRDIGYRSLRAA